MPESKAARTVIRVNRGLIAPEKPRTKTVRAKHLADYPHVAPAHLATAKRLSSPLLVGPPICDELIAFVEHTFTVEEADIVRLLGAVRRRTAVQVANAAGRSVDDVQPILEQLAFQKRAIYCDGPADRYRYRLMPIMPGIFEMVLIGQSPETLSDWHRRFAELLEALFETGYTLDYQKRPPAMFHFLPLAGVAGGHPMALPSDRLEAVLDRYDVFGVGNCQCRMSAEPSGVGCGLPLEVCTVMGEWAERGIHDGWLRSVSRKQLLEIKGEAESHGLVTWILNVESPKGQISCSCCGCCCKAMRMVNQFSAPGMIAPPHFMPQFDASACNHCGQCARACPLGAITVDTRQNSLQHDPARCIGCGLCQLACERQAAISMQPVPSYRVPYKSWFSMLLRNTPSVLGTAWDVWRRRSYTADASKCPV